MLKCVTFILLLLVTKSGSAEPLKDWANLSTATRQLWTEVVAPIRSQGFTPENDYRFFYHLANSSSTTKNLDPLQYRFLELAVSRSALERQISGALAVPSSSTLNAWTRQAVGAFPEEARLNLQSIFIRKFETEPDATAFRRAADVKAQIDQGSHFAELAMLYSDARSSGLGGSAGTISPSQIGAETAKVVFALKDGETTGPIRTNHGFHIFRVSSKRQAFSLSDEKDAAMALARYQEFQTRKSIESMIEDWKRKESPTVNKSPRDSNTWVRADWITYGKSKAEPFGLISYALAKQDLGFLPASDWNDSLEEEAAVYAPETIGNIASYDRVSKSPDFTTALKMAVQIQFGENSLRKWYLNQNPTEDQLKAFLEEKRDELYPPRQLYSYLLWQAPLPKQSKDSNSSIQLQAQALSDLLNQVYSIAAGKTVNNQEQALALFYKLKGRFPESTVTSSTASVSPSPIIDPILYRTKVGEVSRPFDNVTGVGIIYMIERSQDHATFERVRDSLYENWRRQRLSEYVSKIKLECGIR